MASRCYVLLLLLLGFSVSAAWGQTTTTTLAQDCADVSYDAFLQLVVAGDPDWRVMMEYAEHKRYDTQHATMTTRCPSNGTAYIVALPSLRAGRPAMGVVYDASLKAAHTTLSFQKNARIRISLSQLGGQRWFTAADGTVRVTALDPMGHRLKGSKTVVAPAESAGTRGFL